VNQVETQLKQSNLSSSSVVLDILIFIAALLLYTITLYPGPGGTEFPGDAAKFQYMGTIMGVPHTPCYPVYCMLTAVWSRLPFFLDTARNISFFSAICAAAALVFLRNALKYAGVSLLASITAVIMLALSNVFWVRATEAGPGAFSFLLASALLCCLMGWIRHRGDAQLFTALIILGIVAGHDPVCIWYAIPVMLFIVATQPQLVKAKGFWSAVITGCMVGFGAYAYVYIRSHIGAAVTEYVHQDASVLRVVKAALNAQFWANYFYAGPKEMLLVRIPAVAVFIFRQLYGIGVIVAIPGLLVLWYRSKTAAILTITLLVVSLLAVIHLFTGNSAGMYWPVYILCVFWTGLALDWAYRKKRIYGIIACITTVVVMFVAGYPRFAGFFPRQNPYDTEELFLAMLPGSVLLVDDMYAWQEIHNYYRFTNPFIEQRSLRVRSELSGTEKNHTYFISPTVKDQLDQENVGYVPVFSNDLAVLYVIGSRNTTVEGQ
jgi:hypothetical protein